jgi:serine/threonine protein kinase
VDGTPFGRYRLLTMLGRGGMGEVWRAYDTTIDRVVALKLLPPGFADDQTFQERFRREAKAAAGLDEPHVVPIHDFGEIDGRRYVTMRLIKGRDLQDLLTEGPLEPARAVGIIEQIAFALDAAHQIGLVHRDVKPSNILVADHDFAYLIDFGIARAAGDTGLTSTGSTIGTWAYMAPERFQTGAADARADTYALACVLYEALTGELPFPMVSIEQIAVAHMVQPPPQASAVHNALPAEIDDVIATGMAKSPDQRYPTTKDLARCAREAVASAVAPSSQHSTSSVQPFAVPARPSDLGLSVPPSQTIIDGENRPTERAFEPTGRPGADASIQRGRASPSDPTQARLRDSVLPAATPRAEWQGMQRGSRTPSSSTDGTALAFAADALVAASLIYAIIRVFLQDNYYVDEYRYLTPFYSPCISTGCAPETSQFWPRFLPDVFLVPYGAFTLPFLFCLTMIYGYHRLLRRQALPDGARTASIMTGVHRYSFYVVAPFAAVYTYDAIVAFSSRPGFGLGLGNVILVTNTVILWIFAVSCLSCGAATATRIETRSNKRNHHMRYVGLTLASLALTDFYIMLVASGTIPDLRFLN